MSTTPAWLPPLNSDHQKEILVKISQTRPPADPNLEQFPLMVRIDARVDFVSASKNTNLKSFCGLSIWNKYPIPGRLWLTSERNRTLRKVIAFLKRVISFGLEGDITWSEKHLDQAEFSSCVLSQDVYDDGDHQVFAKILKFICDTVKKDYNNIGKKPPFSFDLDIRKTVTIPDEELESWHSWFDAKTRSDKFFKIEYWSAISRPRTAQELISEIIAYRKKLTNSSMLEELEREKVVESSSEKCCSICMEEFLLESQVIKLRCGHTFDEECFKKWLLESNTCPLCRCTL